MADLIQVLKDAGFTGEKLRTAWAIAMRESRGNPKAHNTNAATGDNSYGLFQINMLGKLGTDRDAKFRKYVDGYTGPDSLLDPVVNARAMKYMSANGTNWQPWDIDANGYAGGRQGAAGYQHWLKQYPGENGKGVDVGGSTATAAGGMAPDKLNKRELAAEYGYAWRVIKGNPDLLKLFMTAFNNKDGQWTPTKFGLAVKESDWYKNNAEYARNAYIAEKTGGADWAAQMQEAQGYIHGEALAQGVTLTPEEEQNLAHRYIYEGWGEPARQVLMQKEIGSRVGANGSELAGVAADLATTLRKTAEANGLKYDDAYYADAARRVAMGMTTANDVNRQVREDAASKWPTYADQIRAGADVRSLASAYIKTYADVMERDPNTIGLDDPVLRSAMTGVDEKGNFKPMGLWEFEQNLRSKDSWLGTKQGQDTTVSAGVGILRRMGFLGA